MVDHFLLLVVQAALIAVFFAFLWKRDGRERLRYLLKVFAALVLGAVALGWLMYPFPRP
jgi:membrane-associated PAP2 superfamily phosphatase